MAPRLLHVSVHVPYGTDSSVAVAKVYTGVADTWYISVCLLRRARRKLHFDPFRLGDL